jgi:hypothetical protein
MARKKSANDGEEAKPPEVTILERNIDLAEADLTMASFGRFQKLAKDFGLTVRVYAVRVKVETVMYSPEGKRRGEVAKEGHERLSVFMTMTNMEDFVMDAAWFGTEFQNAYMAGPRARSNKKFGLMNALKEARECLI